MERTRVAKRTGSVTPEEVADNAPPAVSGTDLSSTDELLAEIDAVLDDVLGEQSATSFVRGFKQKGGE